MKMQSLQSGLLLFVSGLFFLLFNSFLYLFPYPLILIRLFFDKEANPGWDPNPDTESYFTSGVRHILESSQLMTILYFCR